MSNERGFNGERDLITNKQTACIIVGSLLFLLYLAVTNV